MAAEQAGSSAAAAELAAAAAAAAQAITDVRGSTIEFDAAVEVIYHRARASWYDALHRWAMFGGILAGSAAAADVANVKVLAITAAMFSALDLVFDLTTRSTVHRDITRDYLAVVAELKRRGFSGAACDAAQAEVFRISAIEPAPYNGLRALAYNQAVDALDRDPAFKVLVSRGRRWLANLRRFDA